MASPHLVRKIVSAMVVPDHSEAKKDGYDLVFMVCGQGCGKVLSEALNAELASGAFSIAESSF